MKNSLRIAATLGIAAAGMTVGVLLAGALSHREASPAQPSVSQTPSRPSSEPEAVVPAKTNAPLYVTTMTHLESNWKDDEIRALFDRHVASMRWAMDLFDEYGAKLTFESEQPFAKASAKWGVNVLREAVERGHGAGTHADFGAGSRVALSLEEFTQKFRDAKALVDALVGPENNRGVSGGTGPTDWVIASANAGFVYRDAITGFGYLSMPMSARPAGWDSAYIIKTAYHDPIPPEFADRLYPIPLKDAKDLVADANPVVTVMGGDVGDLASLAEGRVNCSPDCTYDAADNDVLTGAIEEADRMRDRSRVARVNVHIPLELLDRANESLLRQLLSEIKAYTDKGTVVWATQGESYDGFRSW